MRTPDVHWSLAGVLDVFCRAFADQLRRAAKADLWQGRQRVSSDQQIRARVLQDPNALGGRLLVLDRFAGRRGGSVFVYLSWDLGFGQVLLYAGVRWRHALLLDGQQAVGNRCTE